MSFSMTPVQGFPPASADDFPNYIQFQQDGENLGGPDADTVNFTGGGVSATRGEGENANVVTVDVAGAGGGNQTLVVTLQSISQAFFDNQDYGDWSGQELNTSVDASWNADTQVIDVTTVGVYEVKMTSRANAFGSWPTGGSPDSPWSRYGATVEEAVSEHRSRYSRTTLDSFGGNAGDPAMGWSDVFFVNVFSVPATITPKIYASSYLGDETPVGFSALVAVTRLAGVQVDPS